MADLAVGVAPRREMWEKSMEGMKSLIQKSDPSGLTYVAERVNEQLIAKVGGYQWQRVAGGGGGGW